MAVTRDDVLHVARLARVALEPAEVDRMTEQLNGILAHVDELRSLDLDGVAPFNVAAEGAVSLRPDEPGADPLLQEPGSFAVAWRDGFFTLPRLAAQRGTGGAAP